MGLSNRQRRHLRGLGHTLAPCVEVGAAGLSSGVVAELDRQLAHHELVKVRVRTGERSEREALLAELAARSGAELVSRIGHTALLYRRPAGAAKVQLPAAQDAGQTY